MSKRKQQNSVAIKDEKPKTLPRWVQIIALVAGVSGALTGAFSVWSQFFPPVVDVVELVPVSLTTIVTNAPAEGRLARGAAVILHLRAKNRSAFVHSLVLSGRRHLGLAEYFSYMDPPPTNTPISELAEQTFKKGPYVRISLQGWHRSSAAVKLEPYEERFVPVLLIEPRNWIRGHRIDERLLGFEDGSKVPSEIVQVADWFTIFATQPVNAGFVPRDVIPDIRSGSMNFHVLVGWKEILVSTNKISSLRHLSYDEFLTEPITKLLSDPDSRFPK